MLVCRFVLYAIATFVFAEQSASALVVPRGGETLRSGQTVTISWDVARFGGLINIDLWNGARRSWSPIASRLSGKSGGFPWTVPSDLTGNLFRIRVAAVRSSSVREMSGTYFSIVRGSSDSNGQSRLPNGVLEGNVQVQAIPIVGTRSLNVGWLAHKPVQEIALVDILGNTLSKVSGSYILGNPMTFDVTTAARGTVFVRVVYDTGEVSHGRTVLQ